MLRRVRHHHGFMTAYGRVLLVRIMGPGALFLVSASITMICVTATLFVWTERGSNPNITGWFDALYLTVTTVTGVGFGDIVPITRAGRVIAMVAMLGGTALFAGYTALVASAIMEVGRESRWSDREHRRSS